jgi:hypothetical protein
MVAIEFEATEKNKAQLKSQDKHCREETTN